MNPLLAAHITPGQGPKNASTWSLVSSGPRTAVTSLRDDWRELLARSGDPFAIYQSPEWFDLLRGEAARSGEPSLAIRRNSAQELVGIVPLYPIEDRCVFPLALSRAYVTRPKKAIHITSGRLLLPEGDCWFDGLFNSLARRHGERRIVKVSNVPVPSPLHAYIENSPVLRRTYCIHPVPGRRQVHTIPLEASYDEFLSRYSSKKRYNLRRQFRQLEQYAKGGLVLKRYESADAVAEFVEQWERLSSAREMPDPSPLPLAGRKDRYRRLAQLSLLQSYILLDGTQPIAGLLGHRYGTTLMLVKTLHDHSYNAYSPGSCLLHMIVEQLIHDRSAHLINLGYGYPSYEYRATNVVLDYASYWLMPRTWTNRVFLVGYSHFRRGVTAIKARLPYRGVAGETLSEGGR